MARDDLSNDPVPQDLSLSLSLCHQNNFLFMRSYKELHGHKVNPISGLKMLLVDKHSLELHVSLPLRGMLCGPL